MMGHKKRLFIFISIVTILLTSITTISNSHSSSNAFLGLCGSMGAGMDRESPNIDLRLSPHPDASNRKWTVEELFKSPINFTSYYGEGEGDWFYADKGNDRGTTRDWITSDIWNESDLQSKLKSARTSGCVVARGNFIPQGILRLSSGISTLSTTMTTSAISDDKITNALLDIIGGKEDNDGLIGTFFNSIYMPLVIIAIAFMTVSIIYKGLVKRQLREALSSIIWSTLAFVIGVTLMLNPRALVEIPQKATSTITTCVLGAINGQNCMTNDVSTPEVLTGLECRSEVGSLEDEDSAMMLNGLSCTLWKTFVLEPWAEEQFGVPYKDLYTKNPPSGGKIWAELPEGQADRYCVNLESTSSPSSMSGEELIVDGSDSNTVCNVALYQLYLQTEMHDETNHPNDKFKLTNSSEGKPYDSRWYDIIVPMANNDSNWKQWAGVGRTFGRSISAMFGVITSFLAAIVLVTLGIFGSAYKLIGIIMMSLAPLFLLLAIEPSRGRGIFLGWLETLISSILKYLAIAMMLVISLILYAGVLNNTSGFASLIAVIILTFALTMYRKEIVDLIGATNMGGQRLSNKVASLPEWAKKQVKDKGGSYVAGRVGGSIGARYARSQEIKDRRSNLSNLKTQLENEEADEGKAILQSRIDMEKDGLKDIGYMDKADMAKGDEGRKMKREVKKNKKELIGKASENAGKAALSRTLRRGTSIPAYAFREMSAAKSNLEKDFNKDKEIQSKMMENQTSNVNDNVNDNNEDNSNNVVFNTGNQRERVKYVGNLDNEEIKELNKFADEISKVSNSDDLIAKADLAEQSGDVNKKNLIQSEINARIRFNSIQGLSSKDLSKSDLANNKYMVNSDLEVSTKLHLEKYLDTKDETHLDKYRDNVNELNNRGIKSVFTASSTSPEEIKRNPELFKNIVNDINVEKDKSDVNKIEETPPLLLNEKNKLIRAGVIKENESQNKQDDRNKPVINPNKDKDNQDTKKEPIINPNKGKDNQDTKREKIIDPNGDKDKQNTKKEPVINPNKDKDNQDTKKEPIINPNRGKDKQNIKKETIINPNVDKDKQNTKKETIINPNKDKYKQDTKKEPIINPNRGKDNQDIKKEKIIDPNKGKDKQNVSYKEYDDLDNMLNDLMDDYIEADFDPAKQLNKNERKGFNPFDKIGGEEDNK